MEGGKKKHSAEQKDLSSRQQDHVYWEAPPEVPIQNIRGMLTSMEKELELLNGANEAKRREAELIAKTHPTNTSAPAPPIAIQKLVTQHQSQRQNIAQRRAANVAHSAMRQTVSCVPAKVASVQKVPSIARHSVYSFDRYKRYKTLILQAYQNRKVFTIYGQYPLLREALRERGWIEKLPHGSYRALQKLSQHSLLVNAKNNNEYEMVALSKMLENYPAYFIWQSKSCYDCHNYALPYRNRIRLRSELDFTTKEGLLACMYRAKERGVVGAEDIIHPRTYRLVYNGEAMSFERNFKLTLCCNLLLYMTERPTLDDVFSPTGEVGIDCLEFATKRVEKEVDEKKGIPVDMADFTSITPNSWAEFITDSSRIINGGAKLQCSNIDREDYMGKVRRLIADVKVHWPMFKMDGYSNVWIMKPANYCRGNGIFLTTDMSKMLAHARRHVKLRYIAQKYIERPLLIYKTKFDIRQYVLVSIGDVIAIYIYKDCYVKFSSQEFDLGRLHESVHVTNFAVQRKYKNGQRSELLPPHNMWSLEDLKNYFKSIKRENIWDDFIFPRVIKTAVAVIMSSLETADLVTNAFELYGMDFMLTEDFEPVLLEVNATPDLTHSTCVTAKICPAVQKDLVKVIIDLPKNSKADLGNFCRVYMANWTRGPNNKPLIVQEEKVFHFLGHNVPKATQQQPQPPPAASKVTHTKKKRHVEKRIPLKSNKGSGLHQNHQSQNLLSKTQSAAKYKNRATPATHAKPVCLHAKMPPVCPHAKMPPVSLQAKMPPVSLPAKMQPVSPKVIPHLDNSTMINTNSFIHHFVKTMQNGHPMNLNSPKDLLALQVFRVIEKLYSMNKQPFKKVPPAALLPGRGSIRSPQMMKTDDRLMKVLGEALYNKIVR